VINVDEHAKNIAKRTVHVARNLSSLAIKVMRGTSSMYSKNTENKY